MMDFVSGQRKEQRIFRSNAWLHLKHTGLALGIMVCAVSFLITEGFAAEGSSRLSDKATPYLSDELPERTPPLIELGGDFLGNGNLDPGFELPTGAYWQPRLWVYGNMRTALQTFDGGNSQRETEWANRLDLFANLQLSGSERLLVGVSPLREDGSFTGRSFSGANEGWDNALNFDVTTLFFEGDFGEIFPGIDKEDNIGWDIGFSVGRQPLSFQGGMLINDTVDALGITQNSISFGSVTNLRVTGLWGWNQIDRDDNRNDGTANAYGLLTSWDLPDNTMDIDVVYVDSDDSSLITGGISSTQRFGKVNTTFRLLGSKALDDNNSARADDGLLAFTEISWSPFDGSNHAYINAFAGIDNYSSAMRDPTTGGPLGATGITFAARGLGRFGSPLSNRADKAVGGALGYQIFMDGTRRQLTLEAGIRHDKDNTLGTSGALAARFQQALGRRTVLILEAFGVLHQYQDAGSGLRSEIQVKF
jgi:hypothetical protein